MAVVERKFAPIWDDLRLNSAASNDLIDLLVTGRIKILPLFEVEPDLFARVQEEVVVLASEQQGQTVGTDHPTYKYVRRSDPAWDLKPGTIRQYSLYNSRADLTFNDEDSHWHATVRRFHPRLRHVPEFFRRYFGESDLQNFRMQAIWSGGSLGLHREKIIGIPKRERHFKLRFHLPIVTNPGVRFPMDGRIFSMKPGWVHIFNVACMHGVVNDGDALRIHLIFDCYLNDYILQELVAPAWRAHISAA
jgi:hypothetical protein